MSTIDDALSPAEAQEAVEIIHGRLKLWREFEADNLKPNPGMPGGLPQKVADIMHQAMKSTQVTVELTDEAILAAYQKVRRELQEQARANTYFL